MLEARLCDAQLKLAQSEREHNATKMWLQVTEQKSQTFESAMRNSQEAYKQALIHWHTLWEGQHRQHWDDCVISRNLIETQEQVIQKLEAKLEKYEGCQLAAASDQYIGLNYYQLQESRRFVLDPVVPCVVGVADVPELQADMSIPVKQRHEIPSNDVSDGVKRGAEDQGYSQNKKPQMSK